MPEQQPPRMDKWLWAIRLFKTRSQASQACRAGQVKVDGQNVKPSREIQEGMVIEVQNGPLTRTIRAKALLHNRVGAKLVENFVEDLTPASHYKEVELVRQQNSLLHQSKGRPTKKDRRERDRFFDWD